MRLSTAGQLTLPKLATLSCLIFISANSPPPAAPPIPIPNLGGPRGLGGSSGVDGFARFLSAENALSRGWAAVGREAVSVVILSRGRENGFTPIMIGLVTSGLPPEGVLSRFVCEDTLSIEMASLSSTVFFWMVTSGILSEPVVCLGTSSFFTEGAFSGSFAEGALSMGASFFFSEGDLSLETSVFFTEGTLSLGASAFFSEGTLSLVASAFFSEGTLSLETLVSSLEGAPFRDSVIFFFSASEIQKERVPLVPK